MTEEGKAVYDKWVELVEQISEMYSMAKKAYFAPEKDASEKHFLSRITASCPKMLTVAENVYY